MKSKRMAAVCLVLGIFAAVTCLGRSEDDPIEACKAIVEKLKTDVRSKLPALQAIAGGLDELFDEYSNTTVVDAVLDELKAEIRTVKRSRQDNRAEVLEELEGMRSKVMEVRGIYNRLNERGETQGGKMAERKDILEEFSGFVRQPSSGLAANDVCEKSACAKGSTCNPLGNNYTCTCPSGYVSKYCDVRLPSIVLSNRTNSTLQFYSADNQTWSNITLPGYPTQYPSGFSQLCALNTTHVVFAPAAYNMRGQIFLVNTKTGQKDRLPNFPRPRYMVSLLVADNRIYVVGGEINYGGRRHTFDYVHYMDLRDARLWVEAPTLDVGLSNTLLVTNATHLFIFGGITNNRQFSTKVYAYNLTDHSKYSVEQERSNFYAAVFYNSTTILLFGPTNVTTFNPLTLQEGTSTPHNLPNDVESITAAVRDGRVWLLVKSYDRVGSINVYHVAIYNVEEHTYQVIPEAQAENSWIGRQSAFL